jgi:polyisoprenoid-binding protein YceI
MNTLKAAMLGAAMVISVAATAQTPGNPDPKAVQAGSYTIEPSHTRVQFRVDHMGFTDWYGDFTGASGTLKLDPKSLGASTFDVSVPVASVTTTNAKLDGELRSDAWFGAAEYPTIHFVSSSVVPTGPRTAKVTGQFTFHGVTRKVTFDAKFNGAGVNPLSKAYTVGFNLTGAIKRSDYGVKTYVPLIGDDVTIRISAAFEKTAG